MAEPKTRPTGASVTAFLQGIPDESRRKDGKAIAALMKKATGLKAEMWGTAIVGFGRREISAAGGKTMDWPIVAFSPRAAAFTLYLKLRGLKAADGLLKKLGRHKTGGGCLYITRMADIDLAVLERLVKESAAAVSLKG